MTIEQDSHYPVPQTEESHTQEMEQMQLLWQELPEAHQVVLALQFVDTIMSNEYRPYFRYLMAQKWPLKTTELESAYPTIEITKEDLLKANLEEEEIGKLSEDHRQRITETMRSHYIHDLFWPEVKHLATIFLQTQLESDAI